MSIKAFVYFVKILLVIAAMDTMKIVVISPVNGPHSELECKINPQNFKNQMVLGVTSFSHGQVFNITRENNKFICEISTRQGSTATVSARVPPGRYTSTFDLMVSVSRALVGKFPGHDITLKIVKKKNDILDIILNDSTSEPKSAVRISVKNGTLPWTRFGIHNDLAEKQTLKNIIVADLEMGFLYCNLVESSYINDKLSRHMTTIPLYSNTSYQHYEFHNPVLCPIKYDEFGSIGLSIRGLDGKLVQFDPNQQTIINLSLQPINRIM